MRDAASKGLSLMEETPLLPLLPSQEGLSESSSESGTLNAIRTDTVLSRLPIHNFSKSSRVTIEIDQKNIRGDAQLRWEVSYNERYGPARGLAYKLDTLIINRRIDELRGKGKEIPRLVRLGSLKQICAELGCPVSGPNLKQIRQALMQNASTVINALVHYKDIHGCPSVLEATFTRYSVVLTGQALPETGERATAVHIHLNEPYHRVISNVPVRPLDYDYQRQLSPATQRWYEIISYRIFAAIKYGKENARITYGEYCMYSATTRTYDNNQMRVQMRRLHEPHLKSGYI
ncbi:MAG: hypothetical protein ACREDR_39615, partial [Blastocatellia bacterium]